MFYSNSKVSRLNVNSKGSIARSKLKLLDMGYIAFGAKTDAKVYFAVKTNVDYTSVDLTLDEVVELQAQLAQAIEVAKNLTVKLALEKTA